MSAHPTSPLELRAGELRLVLLPEIGGAIAGLWRGEQPVLRSAEPGAVSQPREAACFPLVPYGNRLGFGHFRWHGQEYRTAPSGDDTTHSMHGVGWRRPWRVLEAGAASAELACTHAPDVDWPFAFTARQRFELGADSLTLSLAISNQAGETQPVGLGWHPYFPKRGRSRLHVDCSQRWEADTATRLPTRRVAQPGIDAELRHLDFDHGFEGWRGAARLRDEKLSLRLTSSLPYVHVFTPPERDHYCVEPMSHVANALHMADPLAHGVVALEPGQTFEAWMKLEVAPA